MFQAGNEAKEPKCQFAAACVGTGTTFVNRRKPTTGFAGEDVGIVFVEEFCGVRRLAIFLNISDDSRVSKYMNLHVLFLDRVRIDAPLVSNKIQPHVFDELALGKNSAGPETNPVLRKEFRKCRIILLLQLGNLGFYSTKRLLVSGGRRGLTLEGPGTRKKPMSRRGTSFRTSRLLQGQKLQRLFTPK